MTARRMNVPEASSPWITCQCGKRGYSDRKAAKKVLKRAHPEGGQMRAYRCNVNDTFWHVGHVAEPVKRGRVERSAFYGRKQAGA